MRKTTSPHRDLYQETTDRILAALESGVAPWQCDWLAHGGDPTRVTGERYRGINVLLLGMSAMSQGFANPHWMTFKQALELGAAVRKGEKGTPIVFFKSLLKDAEPGDPRAGDDGKIAIPCLRGYTVFNVEQIDGLPAHRFQAPAEARVPGKVRDAAAEAALRSCGATITEGGARAFYRPSTDSVTMPDFDRFHTVEGYLATLAHELAHWTGAPHRLARTKGEQFGDSAYAQEELVAEISASFIGARLGFFGQHLESHAGYIDHWLNILRGDKKAIFRAAAAAQAAADMVLAKAADHPANDAQPQQLALLAA